LQPKGNEFTAYKKLLVVVKQESSVPTLVLRLDYAKTGKRLSSLYIVIGLNHPSLNVAVIID
jgi:hypothetical protein